MRSPVVIERGENYLGYKIQKIFGSKYICQDKKHPYYDAAVLQRPAGSFLQGYYQDFRYFSDNEAIRDDLSFTLPLAGANADKASQIRQDCNSVSLHFRRTDYLNPQISNFIATCPMAYYQRATNHIASKTGGPLKLYAFSDDVEWVRRNARFDWTTEFVDINDVLNAHYDLYLQSLCAHNIIANSTMSAMGAWLNHNPGKIVVCPKIWYHEKKRRNAHPCPSEWIRIEN